MTIWDRLGIARTNDIREIKKAYAKAVKSCHREEHPKEWQELHYAYEKAMAYAKGHDRIIFCNDKETAKEKTLYPTYERKTSVRAAQKPKKVYEKAMEHAKRHDEIIILNDKETAKEKTSPFPFERKISARVVRKAKKKYTPIFEEIIENADDNGTNLKKVQSPEAFQNKNRTLHKMKNFASFKVTKEMRNWHAYLFSYQSEKRYLDFYFWEEILRALNYYKYHRKTYQQIVKDIQEIRTTLTNVPSEIIRLTKEICSWCNHYAERKRKILISIRNNICIVLVLVGVSLYVLLGPKDDDHEMVTLDFQELAENYENQQGTHTLSGDEEELSQFVMTNGQLPQGQVRLTTNGNFFYFYQDERYATVKEAMNARTNEIQSDRFKELADLFYEEYGIALTVIALPQEVYEDLVTDRLPLYLLDGKCPINEIYVSDGYLENKTCYTHPVTDGVWAVEQIPDLYYTTSANDFFNSLQKESIVEKNGDTWNIKLSELFVYDVVLVFDEDKYVVDGAGEKYVTTSKYGLYQISVNSDRDITFTVQSFDEP